MTSESYPIELTCFSDDTPEWRNVPVERMLAALGPELPRFMARVLGRLREESRPTYRPPEPDDVESGCLGSIIQGRRQMSFRIDDAKNTSRFEPSPGKFGVTFTIRYTGDADAIPDLRILVPVDLDGRPAGEAWSESTQTNGLRTPPCRNVFTARQSESLRDLLALLVEQGLAHRRAYPTRTAGIAHAEYRLDSVASGGEPNTTPDGNPTYKLWSRLLLRFEASYRNTIARNHPRVLAICWSPTLETYPTGLFAHLKVQSCQADLRVEHDLTRDESLVPTAEIRITFRTEQREMSRLTMRLIIDAGGQPLQILSCVGMTVSGDRADEPDTTPSWYGQGDAALNGFIGYLTDEVIRHLTWVGPTGPAGHRMIDDARTIALSIMDRPIRCDLTSRIKAPESPTLDSLYDEPIEDAATYRTRKRDPGASLPPNPDDTAKARPPVPLFTPLDADALAGKTQVKIYDFEALERELAAQPPPDEDGDRPSPGQIQMISRLHRLGAEGATRWLEHGHAAMIEALADVGRRAPHFGPVTDFILTYVRASANTGAPLRLPPTLIVDEPGTGKTWYLSRIAAALGVPFATVSMAAITTGDTIQGSHPIWRNASQGIVSKLLLTHAIANGVVFVDEFDKPTENGGPRGSLYRPYHAALERENARCFTDDFLGLAMNASHLIWVLAANAIEPLPDPIQDRVTQVKLAPMTAAHRRIVAASIYKDCNADYAGWYQPEIGEDALAVLEAQTPRQMRKAIDHALARAGSDNRRALTAADLKAGVTLSENTERGSIMGFTAKP